MKDLDNQLQRGGTMKNFMLITFSLMSLTIFAAGKNPSYGMADHSSSRVGSLATICGARKLASEKVVGKIEDDSRGRAGQGVIGSSSQ